MTEQERSSESAPQDHSGGTGFHLVLVFLTLPCTVLLPHWVYDAHRWFEEPGSIEFVLAVAAMVGTIAILEGGLRSAGELWQEQLRMWPAGKPIPKPDLAVIFWWAMLIWVQVMGLGAFLTTMDGGLRWSAARLVYLVYAVPAVLLAADRWKRWTLFERLWLRWGWAPVLAFGVPWALPRLLEAGVITTP
jgi:hypothetical protein